VRVALSAAEAERLLTEQSPEVVMVDLLISGNQGLDSAGASGSGAGSASWRWRR